MDDRIKKDENSGGVENQREQKVSGESIDSSSIGPAVDESQRESREKNDWGNWLTERLSGKLEHIRQSVSRLFDDHKNSTPLRGFTPHDATHCRAVEKLIHHLLPDSRYRGLREYERFLLLASAWLHDIGMIRGIFGERDNELNDDEIRASHHERSEEFVINHPARCGVEESDAAVLGLLVHLHGASLEEVPECLNVNGETVRVRLLAAYLCLADALHIDSNRAPGDRYAICLAYDVPVSTKIHWIKSRFVSGIEINAKTHKIVLQFKVPSRSQEAKLKDQGVDLTKINRIHDVVIEETTRYLDAVKNELLKSGISYFLTIERQTVPMLLDEQVLRDLKQIVNNPDFMASPSSSRLTHLILRTIADILNLDDEGNPIDENVSQEESNHRRERVEQLLKEIEKGVLVERPCHLDLQKLVRDLRDKTVQAMAAQRGPASSSVRPGYMVKDQGLSHSDRKESEETSKSKNIECPQRRAPDVLEDFIKDQLRQRERVRRLVRIVGKRYFEHFAEIQGGSPGGKGKLNLQELPAMPVTVLLFGYSELVIKALCGFRDAVLAGLLEEYLNLYEQWGIDFDSGSATNRFGLDLRRPYHLSQLERIASDRFRLFVCTGEPKTQTNSKGQLSFHDGSQYAEALYDHGFTNIVLVPDIAAVGNLLHRTVNGRSTMGDKIGKKDKGAPDDAPSDTTALQDPMIDLVMLGVNGIEENRFRHGTGHLGISAAVAALSKIYAPSDCGRRFKRLPRLVFVATQTKYMNPEEKEELANAYQTPAPTPGKSGERWTWLNTGCIEKEGYWIQQGFCGEAVREKVFLIRDRKMQHSFQEKMIRLYNPREEDVWDALADDVILDNGFFYGEDRRMSDGEGIRQQDLRKGRVYRLDEKSGNIKEGSGIQDLKDLWPAEKSSVLEKKREPPQKKKNKTNKKLFTKPS